VVVGIRTWAVHGGGEPDGGHASSEERYKKSTYFAIVRTP